MNNGIRTTLLLLAVTLSSPASFALEVGQSAPAGLQAASEQGEALSVDAFAGQVVYVDFWASWCAPCLQAMPEYEALYQKYRDQGFTVLAVNVDTHHRAALKTLQRIKVSYPVVFDPDGQWPDAYQVKAMPSAYLIGRDGRVQWVQPGFRSAELPQIEAAITAAVQQPGAASQEREP
ncbi:TlpA disulfide reductase family protein [Sinimarinibacterium sp. NLF-5-8]|uniref:TlpA family protein disulfide reductase n=1 Tax=Sinimarinibacterium sp. NLF-5-8 TaxID=2698684 RepID=UPI00137BF0FA|nr:TlpA disulfide reductase family protein [Sinimarinibacterium sp. NLF-5-8]QHS10804.1 TlpA family protein disulfide reductase [Sinimarinibacterium sp. NLF-5-8]